MISQMRILSALRVLTAFVLVGGFSSVSQAQARTCSSLFTEIQSPSMSAVAKRLDPTLQEFRAQMEQRVGYENIALTLTPSMRATLSYMRNHLTGVEAGSFHTRLDREGLVTDRYRSLTERIRTAEESGRIGYLEFIRIAEQFTVLASVALVNRNPSNYNLETSFETFDAFLKSNADSTAQKIVTNRSEWLFLPLITELGVPTMNELQAMGIAVLGVTAKVSYADALEFQPDGFFRHDFDHAFNYERQPFRNQGLTGWVGGGRRWPTLRAPQRLEFFRSFRADMATNGLSSRGAHIRENLWFVAFHESGYPIHPANLRTMLEQYEANPDAVFKRLSHAKDLGFAFRNEPVTLSEVQAEIAGLLEFARTALRAP